MSFTFEQFYVSTAEDELNYFTEIAGTESIPEHPPTALPSGTYRVLAGQLYRIVPGIPPSLDTALDNSVEENNSEWLQQV